MKKIFILLMTISLVACSQSKTSIFIEDIEELKYEYTGDEIKIELSSMIDDFEPVNIDNLVDKSKVVYVSKTVENGKEEVKNELKLTKDDDSFIPYIRLKDLGVYEFHLQHKKEKLVVKVYIEDTTVPVFDTNNARVELHVGSTKVDVISQVKANDLFPVVIDFDESKVDFNTPGEYKVNIKATDSNMNTAIREFIIVVK